MTDFPRLTNAEAKILAALLTLSEAYGLQIVRHDESISRGGLYVTLARMKKKGFVDSRVIDDPEQSGPPRPLYFPTGLGERALQAHQLAMNHMAEGLPA